MTKTLYLLFALFATVSVANGQTGGNDLDLASIVIGAAREPNEEVNLDSSSFTEAFPEMSRGSLRVGKIKFTSRDAVFNCEARSQKSQLCRYVADSPLLTIESIDRDGDRAFIQVKREQRLRISPYVLMTLYRVEAQRTPKGWKFLNSKIIGQS